MRKVLIPLLGALLLPCLQTAGAPSTGSVTGTVVDSATRKPVGYATVALRRDSTTTAAVAVAADADGRFILAAPAPGAYELAVTAVGYKPLGRSVEIPAAGVDIGTVGIEPGVDVGDVVIEVQKPLVMSDAEKTTYSVEDDPQSSSSTLDEIIRKVPQLSLDGDGNVLLNGQSDYKILLNGRNSATLSNNFKEVIQSMPASQISRIEVITDPSTKYEAEGVGGIINLITQKKKLFHGYNGSVGTNATVLENASYGGNANLSLQAGKFAAGVMGFFGYFDSSRRPSQSWSWQENYDAANRYTSSYSQSKGTSRYGNVGVDMSYQPDTLNLLTLSGWLWLGHSRYRSSGETQILGTEAPILEYGSRGLQQWDYKGGSVALNYEHTFGKEGHTLTLSDEVEISPNDGTSGFRYTGGYDYRTRQNETSRMKGNTVQIDYANPLSKHHNIEAGLKHIYRFSTSDTRIFQQGTEDAAKERLARTEMDYRQHILGLYAGYGFKFAKWSGRAGARMERTWNDADVSEPEKEPYTFSNRQFNVVPYLSLTFTPKTSHNLSLSYTQRLQRPGLYMLSPAVDDTNPTRLSYGNPDLEAAVYHSLNLKYGHYAAKWSMTLSATASLSNNSMSAYSFSDTEGITHTTYSNDVHVRGYGFNGSFSYRPSSKFNVSCSLRGNYMQHDFDAMDIHTDHFAFSENINLDFAVWKQGRILFGESYANGYTSLGSKSDSYYYYYIGFKQQFFKKKLDVSVTCSNPFEKYRERKSTSDTPTYGGWSKSRYACRSLGFRISFRFGKQDIGVKHTSRSISNDDLTGDSKGGGGAAGSGGGGM